MLKAEERWNDYNWAELQMLA